MKGRRGNIERCREEMRGRRKRKGRNKGRTMRDKKRRILPLLQYQV